MRFSSHYFILIVFIVLFYYLHFVRPNERALGDGTQLQCTMQPTNERMNVRSEYFDGNILFETIEIEMRLRVLFKPRIKNPEHRSPTLFLSLYLSPLCRTAF